MPEIPEILSRAREIDVALRGRTITHIEVIQPKSLNLPAERFQQVLSGGRILGAHCRGKWIFVETTQGWLLLNLGMGGELLHVPADRLPEKHRLVFTFDDQTALSVNFWWFGYAHYAALDQLGEHEMTSKLGPNVIDLGADQLWEMIQGKRGRLKTFLLDQAQVAGIGNAYIHDILFLARLHPLRALDSLSREEVERLVQGIQGGLQPSIAKGGAFYEPRLDGQPGGFKGEDLLVGYREGRPCPQCGTPVEKIKTGSTSSFICPQCQPAR
jgi:formamidopyrimidine-DNA glycosylase